MVKGFFWGKYFVPSKYQRLFLGKIFCSIKISKAEADGTF